jgi:alpha-L-fucosidase
MFEKDLPGENRTGYRKDNSIADLPLETCETMNNSWGYNINDRNYKSSRQIIQMLVNAAGRNANLLLNVGPMPDGIIQSEFTDTLAKIGKWMHVNGETIYNTRGSGVAKEWGVVTAKNKSLFVHILKRIDTNFLFIPGLKQTVAKATVFGNQQVVKFKQQPEGLFIYLNDVKQDDIDTIIVLETK